MVIQMKSLQVDNDLQADDDNVLRLPCQAFSTLCILIFTHQQQTAFENNVGKEEIARDEQFLLFPHCVLLGQITVPYLSILLTSNFIFC